MGACVLIFANKQDLKDALTVEELTQKLSLHSIQTHDWHIQSCCAVDGASLVLYSGSRRGAVFVPWAGNG